VVVVGWVRGKSRTICWRAVGSRRWKLEIVRSSNSSIVIRKH
jgi:hypothetical protein